MKNINPIVPGFSIALGAVTITLTSKQAWLHGSESDPKNTPSAGGPRHIYDEANKLFGFTIDRGDRVMLRKDERSSSPAPEPVIKKTPNSENAFDAFP